MYTVYQTFHNECLKIIIRTTFISSAILYMFKTSFQLFYKRLINVFGKNVSIENIYKTGFKHYSLDVCLEMFTNPKIIFCRRLDQFKTFLIFTGFVLKEKNE